MKFRRGFVTNSSSSSFVVAVKSGASTEDIENELRQLISEEELDKFWDNEEEYASEDESKEMIIPEMAKYLERTSKYGITIEDYFVGVLYWYEADDLVEIAIEEFVPKGELVKVGRAYQ